MKGSISDVSWHTFMYETDDKSIVEANWDKPYYFNDDYFLFIGGHVFYRISEADKTGRYVPSPEEVLKILLLYDGNHFEVLKGNYHFLLFNRKNRKATIYSSPLSLYPAWYSIENGKLTVSNIMEGLLKMKNETFVDNQGLVEFSLFDHTIGTRTFYKDIFQLTGGHKVTIDENGRDEEQFYDISRRWFTNNPAKKCNSLHELDSVLKRHIFEFTNSIRKFNISLTGGFDGRLNFSFINKADYPRLQAFSYGMKESLQLQIPDAISRKLKFNYKGVVLGNEFEKQFAELGMDSIILTGGVTPFIRANYPYGYSEVNDFSRNCILGQCDFIRPLYTNPAGAIFNTFSHAIFYSNNPNRFYNYCRTLSKTGFLNEVLFEEEIIKKIYQYITETYVLPYPELDNNERYYFFLVKESMLKFWQTECHLVDLFVNDFISFSDLDYIETLSKSEYFGLYKGIFASNQFMRRNGQDLYADLMHINNNDLNGIITDRFYKPKWIRKGIPGYFMIALGKLRANQRKRISGNDTFSSDWSDLFYRKYNDDIDHQGLLFNISNLKKNSPYVNDNAFRRDRHVSLKLWLQYMSLI
ncbi:MAG: hypothetical protein WAW07_05425 [Bacteroidales bacterium]